MTETNMPVTEAVVSTDEQELVAYELAYHVLPTVAEGEVKAVTDTIKQLITSHNGTIFDEESAERFELAYEIEKYLDGKYRHFGSAYFGWIRFRLAPVAIKALAEDVEGEKLILRHLLTRLTKVEEANPFRFHEAIKDKRVTTIDTDAEVEAVSENDSTEVVEAGESTDLADTEGEDEKA